MFIPNKTKKEKMLKQIGVKSIEDLFSDIPDSVKSRS